MDPNSQILLLCSVHDEGKEVMTDGPLYVLSEFVSGFPELFGNAIPDRVPGARAQRTKEQKDEWDRLVAQYPWLATASRSKSGSAKRQRVGMGPAGGSEGGDDEEGGSEDEFDKIVKDVLDEEELEKVFVSLDEMRKHWEAEYGMMGMADFKGGLLGGASTYTKTGYVADNVACKVISEDGEALLRNYGMSLSKRCSIQAYTMGLATTLSEGGGHKMQYYLDLYRRSGDPPLHLHYSRSQGVS